MSGQNKELSYNEKTEVPNPWCNSTAMEVGLAIDLYG